MNDETILALGGFCKELLGDSAFHALVQLHEQQCASDLMRTQPHETKRREYLYAAFQGFQEFRVLAEKFAEAFDALPQHQDQSTVVYTPDPIDDPRVHDIYDGQN
ncbi:hypothetical protein [Bradyrhizobium barranii]